jgi:hypothetical protein
LAGRGTALLGLLSACGLLLAFRWFRRPLSGREWLAVAAWGIALGLLPKLIVRPGSLQFYKVLPPLLIASGLLVEDAVFAALRRRGLARLAPGILSLTLLLALVPFVNARLPRWPASLPNLDARLGSIPVDPAFASLVGKVRAAVDRRLPAGEPIWVRDAPGWYLLLDRPPADRSPAIIWLATADQRRAVVERVSARPPSLVLRHRMRDELDGIPMEAYAPEVDDFIASNYRLAERVRAGRFSVELMERVAPPG